MAQQEIEIVVNLDAYDKAMIYMQKKMTETTAEIKKQLDRLKEEFALPEVSIDNVTNSLNFNYDGVKSQLEGFGTFVTRFFTDKAQGWFKTEVLEKKWKEIGDSFSEKSLKERMNLGPMQEVLTKYGDSLKTFSSEKLTAVKDTISTNMGKIGSAFSELPIVEKAGEVFAKGKEAFSTGLGKISEPVSEMMGTLRGKVTEGFQSVMDLPIIQTCSETLSTMASGITTSLTEKLGPCFTTMSGFLSEFTTAFAASPLLMAVLIAAIIAAIAGAFAELWTTNDEWRANVEAAWVNLQEVLMNIWENVIQPIFTGIIALAVTVWEGGLKPLWEAWVELVAVITNAIMELWNFLAPYINEALEFLGPILTGAFTVVGVIVGTVFNTILGVITSVLKAVTGAITLVVESIGAAKGNIENVILAVKDIFSGIIDFIKHIFTGRFDLALQDIGKIVSSVFTAMKETVAGVWNGILALFANGGKIFSGVVEGIANVFKNIVNTMIVGINKVIRLPFDGINGFLNKIRSVGFLGIQPFLSLWGVNPIQVPAIPVFARGAIVTTPTPAIFGEAGAEAVIPLENNTGWMGRIAMGISSYMNHTDQDTESIVYLLEELLDTIKRKDTSLVVNLNERALQKSNQREAMLMKLRTG